MSLEGCLLNHECSVCSKTHILCHKFPFVHCFDCIHKLRFMPFGEFSNCDLLDYRLFRSILISKTIHFLSYIFLTLYHFGRNRQSSWYFLVCFFFLSCGVSHFPPVMVGFSCLCSLLIFVMCFDAMLLSAYKLRVGMFQWIFFCLRILCLRLI